jgi:hypothetical protein
MSPREITCRSCQQKLGGIYNGEQPDGWYTLSVSDLNAPNGRGYRYLGLFCSVACLANHMPEMARVEQEIQNRGVRHG